MSFQTQLHDAKIQLRTFIRENWSDQKLIEVYAFNADGNMQFHNACCCLIGVTDSDTLHQECQISSLGHHYLATVSRLKYRARIAEDAYETLDIGPVGILQKRQKRFSAILRAEMRRRERVRRQIEQPTKLLNLSAVV